MRDLNGISIEAALKHHSRFYVHNNAYIVLVGDFDASETLDQIKRYFGGFKRGKVDRPDRPAEPVQITERRTYVEKPVGTGLFQVVYATPAGAHPDFIVMEVIDKLLTGGKGSRLKKALVYGDAPLAKDVSSFAFPFVDKGPLQIEVEMLPGKPNRLAEERVEAELKRLREQPVQALELQRAVAQLRADVVRQMTTTHSRAQLIGFSVRATGDPALPWKRLTAYGDVTPAQIQRVAAEYLAPQRRTVGHAVDQRKIVALAGALLKAHPSDAAVDALLLETLNNAAAGAAVRREKASVDMEITAIARLKERAAAEKARLVGDAEAVAGIDTYMAKSDKGAAKRSAVVEARAVTAADAARKVEAKRQAIASQAAEIRKRPDAKAMGEAAFRRLGWVTRIISKPVPLSLAPTDTVALAEWALEGLTMRHFTGAKAPNVAPTLARKAPKSGPLLEIWNFAHTAQTIDAGRM